MSVVVDTSSWVNLFRGEGEALEAVLDEGRALLHPFVYGELLLGGVPVHGPWIDLLAGVPPVPLGTPSEVAAFIRWAELAGTGVGYVDVHLLMSARLIEDGRVLSDDRKLATQADRLGIRFLPS